MKFQVNTNRPVTTLQMKLWSADIKMERHFAPPLRYPYPKSNVDTMYDDSVWIDFEDTYEIDMLIMALEKFKQEAKAYYGYF